MIYGIKVPKFPKCIPIYGIIIDPMLLIAEQLDKPVPLILIKFTLFRLEIH